MTRQEEAEALLLDVQGLDETPTPNPQPKRNTRRNTMRHGYDSDVDDDEVFGADDPIRRAGLTTLAIQLTIANAQQLGNAAAGLDLFKNTDLAAAALPTGVVIPVLADYKSTVAYLLASPSLLQSMVIQSNESNAAGAPVMSSLVISPKRVTPFGANMANAIAVQSYMTTQDFQANRVTIPLKVALDTFTFLNLVTGINTSGAAVTLNITLMIGKRVQAAKQLKGQPVRVLPGGRGPVNAK